MGRRLDPTRFDPVNFDPASDEDLVDMNVGFDYYAVGPDLLIEKGDEYLHPSQGFMPFPLEAVGRPLSRGLLARRPVDRRRSER
jgi:hypothetical protein